jgi:hypothetical protein
MALVELRLPTALIRPNGQIGVSPEDRRGAVMKSTGPIGSVPLYCEVSGEVAGSTVPTELAVYVEVELHLIPAASTEVTVSVTLALGVAPLIWRVRGVSTADTLGLTVSCKPPAVAVAGMTATIAASTTPAQTMRNTRRKVLKPMMAPSCSQPVREASGATEDSEERGASSEARVTQLARRDARRWSGPRLAEV